MLQNISATLILLCINACHAYPVVKFALEMAHLCSWLGFFPTDKSSFSLCSFMNTKDLLLFIPCPPMFNALEQFYFM